MCKDKIRYITATSDEYINKSRLPIPLQKRLSEYEKEIGRANVIDCQGNINCYNCEDCSNCSDCENCKECVDCHACQNCSNCKNCTLSSDAVYWRRNKNVYEAIYEFYYEKVKIRSVQIHDDGHPDVAAMYLNRALKDSDCNKYKSYDFNKTYDFIEKFVKSNDGEITSAHWDTKYIKYIYEIDLPMQKITSLELIWGTYKKIEVCSIKEFLKRHQLFSPFSLMPN